MTQNGEIKNLASGHNYVVGAGFNPPVMKFTTKNKIQSDCPGIFPVDVLTTQVLLKHYDTPYIVKTKY